jgi:hypothetical protein
MDLIKELSNATYTNKKTNEQVKYSKTTLKNYVFKYNQIKNMTINQIVTKYNTKSFGYLSALLMITNNIKSLQLSKVKQKQILVLIKKSNEETKNISYEKTKTESKISFETIRNKFNNIKDN